MPTYYVVEQPENGGESKRTVKIITSPSAQWAGDGDTIRALQRKMKYAKKNPANPQDIEALYQVVQGAYMWMIKEE